MTTEELKKTDTGCNTLYKAMSYEHAKTQRRGESYVNSHANKMMTSQANIHAAFFF